MREIKKDKYYRDRGKTFTILRIICVKCHKEVLLYQKDGRGSLLRLYLNRILAPESLASLQDTIKTIKDMHLLKCDCGNTIGIPMMHWEGRLAFKLIHGSFIKNKYRDKK